ncbi:MULTISPECIES: prepilin-type N-terminal cleavage/methylation domain-containing protein [unclassified Rhizobacter]|uniref:prepilin-type N-terminal cleavage/methylation domain-containing protein n=1 Tax=unclassified Rhizobacter TaxID=2640088 RepID=UPI0006F93967|nr:MULTISPECIES: prepilin-type N-terminal cleavage/methylation domain-containing protein [unclassified Rhizobacter]KQU67049.1 general secretion pathway protein GspJ [Rhizobacter sp. Root29]KQV98240.1 general secretion pathway protein GspJ [Rhizobacter sp. Root1238]KRB02138.1 general secretion pathway protein GspJ [Rhizobacter sp. Root16D2]
MDARHLPLPRTGGFTLIEVLVAMTIMAIVAMMSWQGVDGIVRARAASQQRLEQVLRVSSVLAQWEQDLDNAQDSGVLPSAMAFDGASMRVSRRVPGGMQMVVWSLRGGTWLRWAGPVVTTASELQQNWMSSQQFLGSEVGQLRTLTGLSDWQVYYYRGNAWTNAQSSADPTQPNNGQPNPPSGITTPLPQGVRLVLSFGEGSGFSGNVTRDVTIGPQ